MKVIDSFMFSEPYERELLLVKFEMEQLLVDEWLIVEGAYTFQGEHKGHYLNKLLIEDNRFAPYVGKIRVLEMSENHNKLYVMSPLEYLKRYAKVRIPAYRNKLVALSEEAAFFAEASHRETAITHCIANYADRDFIILTDVDEMLDAADDRKRSAFLGLLQSCDGCFRIRRKVFVYDFDNLSVRKRYIPVVSVATIKAMKGRRWIAQYIKHRFIWEGMRELKVDVDVFYEFSYCFDKPSILRKTKTFAHTGRGERAFERALLCNHANREVDSIDAEFVADAENWFEKIDVSVANLPSVVVQQFERLRTNTVAANYKEMREKYYHFAKAP